MQTKGLGEDEANRIMQEHDQDMEDYERTSEAMWYNTMPINRAKKKNYMRLSLQIENEMIGNE